MNRIILCVFSLGFTFGAYSNDTLTVMHYNLTYFGNTGGSSIGCNNTNNNPFTKKDYLKAIVQYAQPDIVTCNEMGNNPPFVTYLRDSAMTGAGYAPFSNGTYTNQAGSTIVNAMYYRNDRLGIRYEEVIPYPSLRDINVYHLYYKSPELALGADTVFISLIVIHFKASNATADQNIRQGQATAIMSYLNVINSEGNYLLCGDFNMPNSNQAAYQTLINYTANPKMQFYDPVNSPGVWNNNGIFALLHTQSTSVSGDGCKASGGMDDRFDIILSSRYIMNDSAGLKYIPGTYKALGQDGLRFNLAINNPANSTVPANVVAALAGMSDHLPVLMKMKITQEIVTGVSRDRKFFSDLRYSNPVQNEWSVSFNSTVSGNSKLRVIDANGRVVKETDHTVIAGANKLEVDMSGLRAGLYIAGIMTENASPMVIKLVKN